MQIPIIALLSLVVAIFIGYKRNVNTGLIGISFAFIVGMFVVGMSAKDIISGFPTSLFLTLMGMTFLFSVAQANKTMDLLATKVAYMAKGRTQAIPFIFFLLSAVLAGIGPGPVVMTALMAPIALSVAEKEDIPALLMASITIAGCLAGGLSSLSASGIIADTLAKEIGVVSYTPIFLSVVLVSTVQAIVFFLAFGGLKLQNKNSADMEKPASFSSDQTITLVVILLCVVGILILGWDISLTAFLGGTILLLINPKVQKQAIAGISWSTLLLVGGVAVLVNVIKVAGGIDLLSNSLASVMSPAMAPSVMAIMAGLMSAVSSASGIVMPTLIPTCGAIAETLGGVSAAELVAAIVVGAHAVTFSPLSTLGALTVAAAGEKTDKEKFFNQMLILGFGNILFVAVLGFVGIFRIF